MKKVSIMLLVGLFLLTTFSVAFASTKIISGTSNGGDLGTTSCTGELHYFNYTDPGEDYAYSETASIRSGTVRADAVISFDSQADDAARTVTSTEVSSGRVYVDDGYQATRAYSYHKYSSGSSYYGSWSGSITKVY